MTGITGDLILDLDEGIVVGVSNGLGAAVPDSSDLSAPTNADVSSPTTYEIWCYDENMVVDSGEILGDYGGCTVGVSDGTLDPTLPLLVLISLFYLLMRRRAEA